MKLICLFNMSMKFLCTLFAVNYGLNYQLRQKLHAITTRPFIIFIHSIIIIFKFSFKSYFRLNLLLKFTNVLIRIVPIEIYIWQSNTTIETDIQN